MIKILLRIAHLKAPGFAKNELFPDEVTCNFLPESIKSELERACHTLPWSRDNHLTLPLDSPLWNELGNFKIPEPQVHT